MEYGGDCKDLDRGKRSVIMDRVRTSPSVNVSGRALWKASHFDTAFVVEDLPLYRMEGGISGFSILFYDIYNFI